MKKSLVILMIALVAISLFVGCNEPGIKSYTVTFETGNETVIEPQTVVEGGKVSKPSDLTKTGYTFGGWYDGETEFDFSTAITKNYDLKAKWTLNTYQVTFDSDGGSPASYDKQFVRDWLKENNLAGDPNIKEIPASVVEKTSAIYKECQKKICHK